MKKIQISPSILSADFSQLGNEIKRLEEGGADMIHVDVMDGHFVPNLTIGPPVIKSLRECTKLPFDVHLMISPVHKYIQDYADAGADIITIHPEATNNLQESIDHIKKINKKVGISLNPETKINLVMEFLNEIDLILIMSVNPGFGGQKFMPEVLNKIKELKKIKISPSILSADFSQLGNEIKRLEEGGADMIHVDVMDGHFVPNLTMGPPIIKALRQYTKLPFDVHLMISPVHKFIQDYADAGADIITIHPEATEDLKKSIQHIKGLNKKVGVSLNPKTKIDLITDLLNEIDLVLIMSVNPGFGGQKFMPEVLNKIKELKKIKNQKNLEFDIEIDGGINFDNSKLAIEAGANILVSGTTIFKNNNGNIKKNIDLLKSS